MPLSCQKFRTGEIVSALKVVNENIKDIHQDHPAVNILRGILSKSEIDILASIAYYENNKLASLSNETDLAFNESFIQFRDMVEASARLAEFGGHFEAASKIQEYIHSHDRDLYKKPYDEQIQLWEGVVKLCDPDSESSVVDKANVRIPFNQVNNFSKVLKEILKNRAEEVKNNRDVPAPSTIAKEVAPYLNATYDTIELMAELGESNYRETLAKIDAELAPVFIRVKQRKTRQENAAE